MKKVIVILILSFITSFTWADTKIASWNVQRLGNGNQKSFPAVAKIASQFDFISIQEVMNEQALTKLEKSLQDETGQKWEYMNTLPLGRKSYKEMYAFFWNPKKVEYVDGAVTYLDRGNKFEREPFSARFKSKETNQQFVVATVHILYGKSQSDRIPEIQKLTEYWEWLHKVYPDTKEILLMGDFNMNPSHPAWGPLRNHARPLIVQGASTLSATDGKFSNLYDNIWATAHGELRIKDYGILNYPKILGWDHKKSRKHVSDHTPVYVVLGGKEDDSKIIAYKKIHQTESVINSMKAARLTLANDDLIKGNTKSKIYHLSNCRSYSKIDAKNARIFHTESEAIDAGYQKAGNCN